ncbi:hypothetical protein [Burkholderia multivorans]|uniref:hypothetical protein n=1 Tax=Burkholderia multivorans TaxID=87883 RepID=UPI001B9A2FA8|nr:hypothetical protein [Burkholderia multivorans]MBR8019523.1 hypothetical protein [Burkholderia multivorans]MBU9647826.1 hypothetical protein [Burkholderia multivorans]MDN7756773.1 hypothetical protein [Burkholderia multivorans]MDN8008218.1 hypothetical protein [Burkholderia multivorans]HEF4730007.1 hypothetical protein [Burkholderia multivorans]
MRYEREICGEVEPQRKPSKRDFVWALATGAVIGASLALWVPNAHAGDRDATCRSLGVLAETVAEFRDAGGQSYDVLGIVKGVRGGSGEGQALAYAIVQWVYANPGVSSQNANTAYRSACQRL